MDMLDDDLVDFLDDEDDQLFSKLYQKLEIGNNSQEDQKQSQDTLHVDTVSPDQTVSTIDGQCDMFEPFIVVECDDGQELCPEPSLVQQDYEQDIVPNATSVEVETTVKDGIESQVALVQEPQRDTDVEHDFDYDTTRRFNILLYRNKGMGGSSMIKVMINQPMPKVLPPHKTGERFVGFFDSLQGGSQYYDSEMNSLRIWDKPKNTLLYARYERVD
ncbi:MAG: hypothetical protein LBK70_03370 [Clostridiales bacterium]|jgi:hypothetical protein|nr:hypothetical protein [Clostridiales bacterium]